LEAPAFLHAASGFLPLQIVELRPEDTVKEIRRTQQFASLLAVEKTAAEGG